LSYLPLIYSYAAFFVAYLIGSLSFAVIVSRAMGLGDPRSYGSRNPGATNVLRSGNKLAAVLTLLLDGLKGFMPVALAQWYSFEFGFDDTTIGFVGVAAFFGHLYPLFFGFKGGKGVATFLGVLLGYDLVLGLAAMALWGLLAMLFRYSSLSSIAAALFAPFFQLMFFGPSMLVLATTVMSLALIWRHRNNIANLLNRREPRIGEKPGEHRNRRHRSHRRLDEPSHTGRASHDGHPGQHRQGGHSGHSHSHDKGHH
jgi:acyl phosphate:glycerol-3-phosphate acyltransferase